MLILCAMLLLMLLLPGVVMDAAGDACRLFVTCVLPGLMPYMILSQMAASRAGAMRPWLLVLLGWGGGSPTGARLLSFCPGLSARQKVRLAVCCATMSPMFLLGTIGEWLGSRTAGAAVWTGVLAGGWMAGQAAGAFLRKERGAAGGGESTPLSLGQAVEMTMRTLLMVCGTMALLRVMAALAETLLGAYVPWLMLPLTTLMEVTTGTSQIARLPLPLPWRTALIAGATGFGGAAVLMQNRAAWPEKLLPLWEQALWQGVHGVLSGAIALGIMLMV